MQSRVKTEKQGEPKSVVSMYLDSIKNIPLLTRAEEKELSSEFIRAKENRTTFSLEWLNLYSKLFNLDAITPRDKKVRTLLKILELVKNKEEFEFDSYSFSIIELYKSGTIRELRPYAKNLSSKERRKILTCLSALTRYHNKANHYKRLLMRSNLRLVLKVAKKYVNCKSLQFLDLIQEGNIGLLRGIEGYDPSLGNRLSTYATWWIRQTITRAIQELDHDIRIPVHLYSKAKKNAAIKRTINCVHDIAPLDTNQLDSDGTTLYEVIPDESAINVEEEIDQNENELVFKDVLYEKLTPREEHIIRLRFGIDGVIPKTLEELGEDFDLSRERIRQLENMALSKMRRSPKVRNLKVSNL